MKPYYSTYSESYNSAIATLNEAEKGSTFANWVAVREREREKNR
jgi:hypothetical protein